MRAWLIDAADGGQSLRIVERAKPVCSGSDVLVRITAAGIVPLDGAIIRGENEATFPPAAFPLTPGNQGAGVVEDPGSSSFAVGQRVMFGAFPYGFMRDGSWAEYVAVDASHLAATPDALSDGAAAQAVVAYPTAYFALKEAGMAQGKTVLATGIGGSVGNAAYQLAKAMGANLVISTAGSTDKAQKAAEKGFDNVIDLSQEAISDGVRRLTNGAGVDIVIDSLGGQVLADALQALARYGRVISLGFSAGRQSTITLADLILVRGSVQGYGAYTNSPEEWQEAWSYVEGLIQKGVIAPIFDKSFPFENAAEGLRYLKEERPFGAVVLGFVDKG